MVIIQLKSEADLAKLIDLVKRNRSKVGQSLADSSARWEQAYFSDEQPPAAVREVGIPEIPGTVRQTRGKMGLILSPVRIK